MSRTYKQPIIKDHAGNRGTEFKRDMLRRYRSRVNQYIRLEQYDGLPLRKEITDNYSFCDFRFGYEDIGYKQRWWKLVKHYGREKYESNRKRLRFYSRTAYRREQCRIRSRNKFAA